MEIRIDSNTDAVALRAMATALNTIADSWGKHARGPSWGSEDADPIADLKATEAQLADQEGTPVSMAELGEIADYTHARLNEKPVKHTYEITSVAETTTTTIGGTQPPVVLADGIPWDSRIHSESRALLSKAPHGWKLRRTPKAHTKESWASYVQTVEAELATPQPEATAAEPLAIETVNPVPPTGEYVTPGAPGTPIPQVATTFPELLGILTTAITNPATGVTWEKVGDACKPLGLDNMNQLSTRTDLIPAVLASLGL